MRWFSHRRQSGGRHNCITYLRASEDRSWKNAARGPRPRGRLPNKIPHFFVFFVPGDLDLWALTSTFELGRDFCTVHLTFKFRHPTFNRSEVIVLANKQTNKQTPLKTSTSLRCATPVSNNDIQPSIEMLAALEVIADVLRRLSICYTTKDWNYTSNITNT